MPDLIVVRIGKPFYQVITPSSGSIGRRSHRLG
jgi:hypothetical protein